ncbi:MAG: hypothetical protein ACRD8W_11935 [Nitrososphaeraceae archaeon]
MPQLTSISGNSSFKSELHDNQTLIDSNILSNHLSDVIVDKNNTSRNTNLTIESAETDLPVANSVNGTTKMQTIINGVDQKSTEDQGTPLSVAMEAVKRIFGSED